MNWNIPEASVLSRTCSNLYGRLNIFLYRHNTHHYNSWGMRRAIDLGSDPALLKLIEQGANPCAMERMGRSPYYNRYIPHEACADEKYEPGTEEIADVARQYEITVMTGTKGASARNLETAILVTTSRIQTCRPQKATSTPFLRTGNPPEILQSARLCRRAI